MAISGALARRSSLRRRAVRATDRTPASVAGTLCAGATKRALVAQDTDAARRRHCGRRGDHRYHLRRLYFCRARPQLHRRCCSYSPPCSHRGRRRGRRHPFHRGRAPAAVAGAGGTLVIYMLPHELRVAPFVPWWAERVLLVVGGVWFVNLVNFMDGLDWMTVAEVVPITAALAVIGGSAPFPRRRRRHARALRRHDRLRLFQSAGGQTFPRRRRQPADRLAARVAVAVVAATGHLAAAILLPLYYLADATITLLAASSAASRSGKRIARISISWRPTAALRSLGLLRGYFPSMSRLPLWRCGR